MTPDKWEKIKTLFEAALEKPSEQRLQYLEAVSTEEDLRAEVARLLTEYADAGSFLSKRGPGEFELETAHGSGCYQAGQVLAGRFKLFRFLARGGMGEVYEAEDQELQQRVAVKLVRRELLLDRSSMQRFRREIHLAKTVTHTNICRTFDLFRHREANSESTDDFVFVSMELLEGETLSQRIRRGGRLTTAEALPLVTQIAAGMSAAHAVGIIHRDFKPSNVVLVPQDGRPLRAVITDFGLALRSHGDTTAVATDITGSGKVVGTPAYMAPEQIEGRKLTPATDIYAFGLVLYEIVTGTQPFSGETPVAMAIRRIRERPPSPRSVVPDLDPEWEAVILRCLERDPPKRFDSATDVIKTLTQPTATAEFTSGTTLKALLQRGKQPSGRFTRPAWPADASKPVRMVGLSQFESQLGEEPSTPADCSAYQ